MLNKLLDKFVPQCTQLNKDEMSAKHAYDMLLKAQIAQASSDRDEKAEFKAETMQVQTAQIPLSMASFKDYSKNKQAGGVQGMIQTIIDDAKAMEIEAIVAEEGAQKGYENFVKDSNASIEDKTKEIVEKIEGKAKANEN